MSALAKQAWADVMQSHSGADLRWGPTNVDCMLNDPKRLGFLLARYKFAAKMMAGCLDILDIGCGDGTGTSMFLTDTSAKRIVGIDIEEKLVEHANNELLSALQLARPIDAKRLSFLHMDFSEYPKLAAFDGLCSLDMIEHVDPGEADWFLAQFAMMLKPYGVAVIGTPNGLAAEYGSIHSRLGHINLYEPDMLRSALERNFGRVFMFAMNDEVVHSGFLPLSHYILAVCVK